MHSKRTSLQFQFNLLLFLALWPVAVFLLGANECLSTWLPKQKLVVEIAFVIGPFNTLTASVLSNVHAVYIWSYQR